MSEIALRYYRVTHGPVFKICDQFHDLVTAYHYAADVLASEVGAVHGRYLQYGTRLEGFYRMGTTPKGWSPAGKKFPGYIKPNRRNKIGEAFARRMDAIEVPLGEKFAHLLGFPPFFHASNGGGYCSAASLHARGGVFFIDFPASPSLHLKTTEGVEEIKEWEFLKAMEEK